MKTHITNLIYTLLLLLAPYIVNAQSAKPTAGITGLLQNEQAKLMDYATVTLLRSKDSSVVKSTLTNDAGRYRFDNINAGQYIVKATTVGYQATFSPVLEVRDNVINAPVIQMQQSSRNLQGVTITSTRPLIERKIDRTVMNVENSVLAAGNTAMEILARAPGVTVDKDDNITLKGKQGVTVMINDKLTYLSAAQLATLLRSTDGNTIKSIEIITNPSAKYDAAGNSGIINIKLKKNTQSGTNGSVTAGIARSQFWRDNSSLNLNHKSGKLNVFGTFSRGDNKRINNIYIDRITRDSTGNPTYFNQLTRMQQANHYNNYRIGADYDVSTKNVIGFVVSGYGNSEKDNNDGNTRIGATANQIDSSLTTLSTIDQTFKNIAVNLNDRFKIDTSGQELSIDLDYSKFKNNSVAQYNTNFFLPNGSIQHKPELLRNQTPSNILIYTAKADYAKPLTKTIKFETGAKFSSVKTDNDLQAQKQDSITNLYIPDAGRTNHFIYTEKVSAGYVNLNKQFKKTSVQVGVRAEYTQSNGNLLGSTQVNRDYLDFFPSVFINHDINDKNQISFSYSRRIDRPGYDNLNPFIYYLDPYTYSKGNAFLKPQYTNNFEFNYTHNKSINVSLGYSRTTDVITEIILTEGNKSFQTNLNLQTQNAYSVNIDVPYTITKWWSGNINVNSFYLGFKSDSVGTGKLSDGQVTVQAKTTQTFTFGTYRFEIMGDYQSPLTYGIYKIKPRYGVDAGLSHSFANKKLNVKLAVDDVFHIRRNNVSSHILGNDFDIHQTRDSRVGRLTVTYNFGNNKIKARQHQTGADEEKNRVKSGG
jgi:iron complex outermembrane receptor protein